MVLLYQRCFYELFRFPWRKKEILEQIVQIGIGSLPIVMISTAFAGLVVTNEIAWHMQHALHTVSMIPGFTGQFIIRELGIAIPALLVVAKVGASIAAEVGSMKITEQIDALKLLGIDPVQYLVFPRFIAAIVSMACMTFFAIAITLTFAVTIAVSFYGFGLQEYINTLRHFVGFKDFLSALVKGMVFGSVIPVIACTYGMECKGGAQGVGSATTQSVVSSTIAVISLDFLLTYFFTSLNV
jgi:phospholipid/cholesterol/gamma-HCH transport system permease protein